MQHPFRIEFVAFSLVAALSCTGEPSYPTKTCATTIWARPSRAGASLVVVASWDGWTLPGAAMAPSGQADWENLSVVLPPGENSYLIVEDGVARLDTTNPLSSYHGEQEVSLLLTDACHTPAIRVDAVTTTGPRAMTIDATFVAAANGPPIDPERVRATLAGGAALTVTSVDPSSGKIELAGRDNARGKLDVSITAADTAGNTAPPISASAWVQPAMSTFGDGVLYQVMIDRFRGDGGRPLSKPSSPGARAGGTLDGVRAEIERGIFDALGVTALWLSPVYVNPIEPRVGTDGHVTESYHGYWPLDSRKVDDRIGGDAGLRAVVAAAHARGIRVLLDLVPNHVYEKNARYVDHASDGWFNTGKDGCVCGGADCDWGTYIDTCWFAPYLPDYRYQDPDVMQLGTDDAIWWRDTFDVDGFRIDAVPMMPRAAMRRMVRGLRDTRAPRDASFTIGEIYTGSGDDGITAIKFELGPDGLDAAFDFPLMWALRDAIATDRAGFDEIEHVLTATDAALRGSGSILGRMMDNHDTSRFVSEADGTSNHDPWSDPPGQPQIPDVYARHAMALTLLFALPGLPVLYYGDEVALAGAGDPDSRRVLPADDALAPPQLAARRLTQRLGKLRACSKALRTGARTPIYATTDVFAFARDAGDGAPVYAVFSKAATTMKLALPIPPGEYLDLLTGESVVRDAIALEPLTARLLSLRSNPCTQGPEDTP